MFISMALRLNDPAMIDRLTRTLAQYPRSLLTGLTVALLVPFLARPFDIDDPLFVWAAKQTLAHPLAPFSCEVNWYGSVMPLWKITENPPLGPAWLALGAGFLGWSEWALHTISLLPALAVVLGTYRLAKTFCTYPLVAALAVLCAPVFLVSSTSVMCDVAMLAAWVWTVVGWVEGLAGTGHPRWRWLAAVCLTIACLTKYYAISLMPLLAAYALARRRPLREWAPCFLLPLAALCVYQYLTAAAFGYSLLYRAWDYAAYSKQSSGVGHLQAGLTALVFLGGCLAPVSLTAPAWVTRRERWILPGLILLLLPAVVLAGWLWQNHGGLTAANLPGAKAQALFWAVGGGLGLWLVATDFHRRREAGSLLLSLWVLGTFWFAAFSNWTVNARSVLPLTPAVAILLVRAWEDCRSQRPRWLAAGLLASAGLALAVTAADYQRTETVRRTAAVLHQKFVDLPGKLWFEGHWGFQYYMESGGALAVDFRHPAQQAGDILAYPRYNTDSQLAEASRTTEIGEVVVPGPRWLTTWNPETGAGFYAAAFGPLPFAFGRVPPEIVTILEYNK